MTDRKPWKVWAVSRGILLLMLALPVVGQHTLYGDLARYQHWADGIVHWTRLPFRDFGWEYPPGAALVIAPPGFVSDVYDAVFITLMLAADLAMVVTLRRLGTRLGSQRGTYLWIAGVTLLGPVVFTRYDTVSSLLAVLALSGVAAGAPVAAGLALGGGIVVKLWPALLVVVVPFAAQRRRLIVAAGAVVVVTVLAVLSIGGARHGSETFTKHTRRGLQVESIAATPIVLAQRAGADVDISAHVSSGSWDVTGTGASVALEATSVASALALALIGVLVLRVRRNPERWLDLAATSLLLVAVSGKVLSPQYELWLLALFAAAVCRPDSPMWPTGLLLVVTAGLSQVVYPMNYHDLVDGSGLFVVGVLVLRNVLLLLATVYAVMRVWQGRSATP